MTSRILNVDRWHEDVTIGDLQPRMGCVAAADFAAGRQRLQSVWTAGVRIAQKGHQGCLFSPHRIFIYGSIAYRPRDPR